MTAKIPNEEKPKWILIQKEKSSEMNFNSGLIWVKDGLTFAHDIEASRDDLMKFDTKKEANEFMDKYPKLLKPYWKAVKLK